MAVDPAGSLTRVECKLRANPEMERMVGIVCSQLPSRPLSALV